MGSVKISVLVTLKIGEGEEPAYPPFCITTRRSGGALEVDREVPGRNLGK